MDFFFFFLSDPVDLSSVGLFFINGYFFYFSHILHCDFFPFLFPYIFCSIVLGMSVEEIPFLSTHFSLAQGSCHG